MADLNALIAQGAQFQALPDPFVQYGRMQQLEQGQQANQLNRMKMDEYQRGLEQQNALSKFLPDLNESNRRELLRYGEAGRGVYKTMAESDTQRRLSEQATSQAAVNKSNILKNVIAQTRDAVAGIDPADAGSYGTLRGSVLEQYPELAPYMPEIWDDKTKQRLIATASSVLEANKPVVVAPSASVYQGGAFSQAPAAPDKAPALPPMVAEFNFAKTPAGGNFKGDYQQFVTARAAAGRAPAAPRPEQPPVAVVDPVTGKPVYVTREQALSGKMTPASAMEGLPPKEIQARESKFPAATSAVKTFESSAEKLATDLERLATHPGLSGISGLVYGRTPAITKDARAAQALYDSIVARGGFQELQNMRASSPTGGALGNVSNQEGQYLRDAFAPINRTQDTTDLSRSLKDAAVAARTSKQRVRDAYDMTYEYKTGGSAAPQGSGGFKYLGKE